MEKAVLYLMALMSPILGIGQIYGNTILRGSNTYVEDLDINPPTGIEIQFFSPTDEYVGMVGTTFDNSNLINWQVEQNKIGDLTKFEFSITRLVDIPFYNQMETKMFVDGILWFSGELQLKPNEDRRNPEYVYEGKGWVSYLKDIKITKLYENKTLEFILQDLIENDIAPNTPIEYSPDLIIPPNITVTKLEFKKKTVEKAIKEILKIANVNYTTAQYRNGVNKDKIFFFNAIDNNEIQGFFEGFQYQNPDVKEDLTAVINQIDLYRAQENSQTVEFISRVEDTESQGLFGLRNRDITLSDFVDTATAENIANAIIERFKEPILEIKIENLNTEENPFDIGFYLVNNKRDDYTTVINEFEDVTEWDLTNAPNTTIIDQDIKILTGKRCFKITTINGSLGEYIEFILTDAFNFPTFLNIYLAQQEAGDFFGVEMEDEDGNILTLDQSYILREDGGFILREDGGLIETEISSINIDLVDDFQKQSFNISSLENIKKFRIFFITNETQIIYFDRFEIFSTTYRQSKLTIEKIIYKQQGNAILADVVFGEEIDNIINDIKKLDNKQINTINIFQKS